MPSGCEQRACPLVKKQSGKGEGLTLALPALVILPLLALGCLLNISTKNEVGGALSGDGRCHDQARASPFNAPRHPFKYAAELSSVLSMPASAQRMALPISATSSSRE